MPGALRYPAWLAVLGALMAVIFLPMAMTLLPYLALAIVVRRRPAAMAATAGRTRVALPKPWRS
jgi:hypothetical protein